MITITGRKTTAKIFTNNIEGTAIKQVVDFCNQDFCEGSKIRIMPDVHAGNNCTIGTTMTLHGKVVPNLVGADIGCGVTALKILEKNVNFEKLERVIKEHIPSGSFIRKMPHWYNTLLNYEDLKCKNSVDIRKAQLSLGTLGDGNHFIEIGRDDERNLYILVHSGSRSLGGQVCKYYQNLAYKRLTDLREVKQEIINRLKSEGREREIEAELKKIQKPKINKDLAYLEGEDFNDYIHDMDFVQRYAELNRQVIILDILHYMESMTPVSVIATIHNYIDTENMILRKGAVSARDNEMLIIPMNMRDGSLLCMGKGNADWNYSAPHGAGRVMSRSEARDKILLEDFEKSMEGIWTKSVGETTIDESPMAYKDAVEISRNISETVYLLDVIKTVYNFKAN